MTARGRRCRTASSASRRPARCTCNRRYARGDYGPHSPHAHDIHRVLRGDGSLFSPQRSRTRAGRGPIAGLGTEFVLRLFLLTARSATIFCGQGLAPCPQKIVAPALTPESYNHAGLAKAPQTVVAPALTPESYNDTETIELPDQVVAPALTPESYNMAVTASDTADVVAPALTPESYNCGAWR